MPRNILLSIAAISLAFTVSCGSKSKKDDVGGEPGSGISSKDISFDAEGSDGGNISGLYTVNFDYDRASISAESKNKLSENAAWIKSNPDAVVQIEGHCDSRGSVEYNLALGERRARAVKSYLVSLGVNPKSLTIISYGEEKLLSTGDSESAHNRNRRANFVPLPK